MRCSTSWQQAKSLATTKTIVENTFMPILEKAAKAAEEATKAAEAAIKAATKAEDESHEDDWETTSNSDWEMKWRKSKRRRRFADEQQRRRSADDRKHNPPTADDWLMMVRLEKATKAAEAATKTAEAATKTAEAAIKEAKAATKAAEAATKVIADWKEMKSNPRRHVASPPVCRPAHRRPRLTGGISLLSFSEARQTKDEGREDDREISQGHLEISKPPPHHPTTPPFGDQLILLE